MNYYSLWLIKSNFLITSNNKINKIYPIKKTLETITHNENKLLFIGIIVDSIANEIEVMANIMPINIL